MTSAGSTSSSTYSKLPQLLLALILSVSAFVQLTVVSRTIVDVPLRADAGDYFSYAYNIEHYGVYSSARTWAAPPSAVAPTPDSLRPPGYPFFLSLVGTPEPTEIFLRHVSFIQAGLGIVSVLLTYLIAAQFLGKPLALVVALLAAINPFLTMISTYLLTESLFLFLLLAAVFTLLKASQGAGWPLYALTGVLWGLCALVRPTAQFLPLLLLLVVLALPSFRRYASSAVLAFACFAAVLAPWAIRNQSLQNSGSGLMVNTLAHGSYPNFMYDNRPETFGFPYRFDPDIQAKTRDLPSILTHIAGRFRAEPIAYSKWYLFGKPYFFLSLQNVQSFDVLIYPTLRNPYYEDGRFAAMRLVSLTLHWPMIILGITGTALLVLRPSWLCLDRKAAVAAGLVAAVIVYAIAFHMVVAPFPRYSIPFRPLIFAMAALPILSGWRALRAKYPRTGHG